MAAAPAGRLPVPHHDVQGPIDVIPQQSACGSREESRNGVTITKFGVTIRYSLKDGISPLFATKKVAWRVCFEELFWFISGCTDNTVLRKWLHWPSLMVLILELDAIEGVIFRYLDSFAALELVFLSTAISTNVLPMYPHSGPFTLIHQSLTSSSLLHSSKLVLIS